MFTPPNMSRVTCHVSCVTTCHVSCVTCHMSHVIFIFIFFLGQSGEVYRWRVCYQRGLPRLVSPYYYLIADGSSISELTYFRKNLQNSGRNGSLNIDNAITLPTGFWHKHIFFLFKTANHRTKQCAPFFKAAINTKCLNLDFWGLHIEILRLERKGV